MYEERQAKTVINKARDGEREAGEKLQKLTEELNALGNTELALSRLNEEQGRLDAEAKELGGLAESLKNYRTALSQLDLAQDACEARKREAKERRDEAGRLRSGYNDSIAGIWAAELEEAGHEAEKQVERLSAELKAGEERLAAIRADLPHPSREVCEASIRSKDGEKSALEQAISEAAKAVSDLEKAVAQTKGQIQSLEEALKGLPPVDLEALQAAYGEKDATHAAAGEREKAVHARRKNNAGQIKSIREQAEASKTLEMEYRMMKDVSDTARGEVTGRESVTLETYVQTSYFDRIIGYANRRLIHMSRNQYDLARQDASHGDRRSQSGLGLDVVDHANGIRRAVTTLSGGEGFLAALSLALGMSDAIQASATSAVQLDTMFVDEGFGSLSERFLALVMDELNDTANSGHRLIGVISHVDDVKEGIERRIEVTKDENGVSQADIL